MHIVGMCEEASESTQTQGAGANSTQAGPIQQLVTYDKVHKGSRCSRLGRWRHWSIMSVHVLSFDECRRCTQNCRILGAKNLISSQGITRMKKCNNAPHCAVHSPPGNRKRNNVHRQSRRGSAFKLITLHPSIFEATLMIMSRHINQREKSQSRLAKVPR